MQRARSIVAAVVAMAGLSFAQSASPSDQETIRTLVQQVRELQAKVKALEAKQANVSPAPEPATPSQPLEEATTLSKLAEPVTLPSNGMQMEAVRAFPRALVLMATQDLRTGMKVVKVDGHLPGDPNYPLR